MSYYWFNILKYQKRGQKMLLNVILLLKRFKRRIKKISIETCQKKKREYQSEKYHMNNNLNEKRKQYQRNLNLKKIKNKN